jgi:hypothetical protein
MRKIQVQVFRKQRIVRIIFDPNREVRGKGRGFDMPFHPDWHDDSRDPEELLQEIIYHVGEGYKRSKGSPHRGWDGNPFEIAGVLVVEEATAQA